MTQLKETILNLFTLESPEALDEFLELVVEVINEMLRVEPGLPVTTADAICGILTNLTEEDEEMGDLGLIDGGAQKLFEVVARVQMDGAEAGMWELSFEHGPYTVHLPGHHPADR